MVGQTQRRLAAIVLADVVGYSRLIGADETGTLDAMRAHRDILWDPTIQKYGGRIVNRAGDSALVEFGSAVAALESSVEIQKGMTERNADVPEDKRVELRIGVNIGEVVVDGEEIYGDGVNIAARLQTLAQPGGIALSGNVYENIVNRLNLPLTDAGEHSVKNISRPVHVWRWRPRLNPEPAAPSPPGDGAPLALPDKPSIAVLPFDNMSGDPEQEYFADGLTEDIITSLSRLRWLFVIARNSSFHYKNTAPDVRQVAEDLGVRYVLKGSVRKASNRVRVNAQLIDAVSGRHIWADRFDRELTDIFDLQDELTLTIAGQVDSELAQSERDEVRIKPAAHLNVWDCCKRGMWHAYLFTEKDNAEALRLFERAVRLNPDFAPAQAGLSLAHFTNAFLGFGDRRDVEIAAAKEAGRLSVRSDDRDPQSHWALGRAHLLCGEIDQAIAEFESAIKLNPSYALGHYNLGWALNLDGQAAAALEPLDLALRLSPRDPLAYAFMIVKCQCYFQLRDFEAAWQWGEQANRQPNAHYLIPALAMAVAAAAGWTKRMEAMKAQLRQRKPDFRPELYLQSHMYKQQQHRQYYLDAFAIAGYAE